MSSQTENRNPKGPRLPDFPDKQKINQVLGIRPCAMCYVLCALLCCAVLVIPYAASV